MIFYRKIHLVPWLESGGRRIYVASSWRNVQHPAVVESLRAMGHEVYDFRNPAPGQKGFAWQDCGESTDGRTVQDYRKKINHQTAVEGFAFDKDALDWSDTCVLVLPCGRSAHLEAGYACGQGKRVIWLLSEDKFEPELMYRLGHEFVLPDV